MANWQNRIVKYHEVAACDLLANPRNARRHPVVQREALRGSLDTLGWIAPVIVNANTGYVIDGHARIEEALSQDDNQLLPVVEVDLSEAEEAQALASYDFITSLATYSRDHLEALLQDVQSDDNRVQALLSQLAESQGITPPDFSPISELDLPRLDSLSPQIVTCPHCGGTFDAREA